MSRPEWVEAGAEALAIGLRWLVDDDDRQTAAAVIRAVEPLIRADEHECFCAAAHVERQTREDIAAQIEAFIEDAADYPDASRAYATALRMCLAAARGTECEGCVSTLLADGRPWCVTHSSRWADDGDHCDEAIERDLAESTP